MKHTALFMIIWLFTAMLVAPGLNGAEPIERIVAIVGLEPIMASELAAQIQLYAVQTRSQPKNQQELDKLQENILNQMINERLFLFEARKDTLIKVTDEEIDQALDEQIARIASQFDSEEAFLDQIALEGMTLREYKNACGPKSKINGLNKNSLTADFLKYQYPGRKSMTFMKPSKIPCPISPKR